MSEEIRAIVWGIGETYNRLYNVLRLLERTGEVKVVGVISGNRPLKSVDGYRYIDKSSLMKEKFQLLIIMSERYFEDILNEAIEEGVSPDMIASYRMLMIPNLNVRQYLELVRNKVSIISNNCWGGLMYKTLGLRCSSPFKNLYFKDDDYIRLLKRLKYYMQLAPEPHGFDYDPVSHIKYPVLLIGDVDIQCNHFETHIAAIERWCLLRERINYDNLFVEMYTLDEDIAKQFEELPYEHKICFVPFKTSITSCYTLDEKAEDKGFWECVNRTAMMQNVEFDQLKLISNGYVERRYEDNSNVSSTIS